MDFVTIEVLLTVVSKLVSQMLNYSFDGQPAVKEGS